MSDIAGLLDAFAKLAVRLTGLQVVAAHMPAKVIDPHLKGRLEFRVIACKSPGNDDDVRQTFDSGTGELVTTVAGLRQITIEAKFFGYDNRATQDAAFYLERLGTRLMWPSARDELLAAGLGLVTRMSFRDLSKVQSAEDRVWSLGTKDFVFNAVFEEVADGTPPATGTWIETVHVYSSTLDDAGGTPVADQVDFTVTRP